MSPKTARFEHRRRIAPVAITDEFRMHFGSSRMNPQCALPCLRHPSAQWFRYAAVLSILWVSCHPLFAQLQGFMRVGTIAGEVKTSTHLDWSGFDASSLILYRPQGSPRVQATSASLSKPLDRSSPLLHKACASGETFATVKIDLAQPRSGAPLLVVYQLILENARLSSINQSGSIDGVSESLAIDFTKLSWTTRLLSTNGTVVNKGAFWDIARNLGGETLGERFEVYGLSLTSGGVQLAWPAHQGQKFKILGSAKVEGPYQLVREITAAETGGLEIVLPPTEPSFFFSVLREL
ncbi:MAG: type VI secretion system tube protein Hcp [Verrucomicrobia bacterium]|nr:type VI secretion system tube protein Hcp [Verrucomicrobiota bacterium]